MVPSQRDRGAHLDRPAELRQTLGLRRQLRNKGGNLACITDEDVEVFVRDK